MKKDFNLNTILKVSNSIKKVTDWFNKINPYQSVLIIFFGFFMLAMGIIFLSYPPTQSLSAGLGTFALGLALTAFGQNQWNSNVSRTTIQEMKERLIRIEKKTQ
jgi:drug/metabolite transporter (DMT)-like permease